MSDVSKEVSAKIANMSLLGALLVISIHCGYSSTDGGICKLVHQIFSGGYSRIAVPFFFLVSGYFLAAHIEERTWWKRETIKRIRTLLVPFASWAFLYQVFFIPLSIYADYRAGRSFGTNIDFFNGRILNVFGLQWDQWPSSIPLWFLRSLFLFVICSPLVVWMIKRIPKTWLFCLFAISLFMMYAPDPELGGWSGFFQHVFSVGGLFYFSLGIYIRVNNIRYQSKRAAITCLILGVTLLALNGYIAYCSPDIRLPVMSVAVPCLMYSTWYLMPTYDMPIWLRATSFPIYLAHSLFLGYWGIFAKNVAINETVAKLLAWPMAFVGCVILANVMRKYAQQINKILFGGR